MSAFAALGISVAFTGDDGGSLTAQLLDINKDTEKTDQIDTTHQLTLDEFREFISGLTDGQSIALLLHFDSDNVRPGNGEAGILVITLPFTGITLDTLTISCNVEEKGDMDAKLGAKMTENLKFKITGKPVWSTAT